MYPYQHDAERRMTGLSDAFMRDLGTGYDQRPITPEGVTQTRILKQLARELLLAQSSDWAFQIYQGTTVQYSSRRFQSHIQRFDMLAEMLGAVSEGSPLSGEQLELLIEIESRDNIFAEIDPQVYRSRSAV
jgi:1,4-alpha-glucan branching enzyme